MSYILISIVAYLLNAVAILNNKFVLVKTVPSPLRFIFYVSALSLLTLLLLPITAPPDLNVFVLASMSSIFWTVAAFLMFTALKAGQASRVVPVIGSLVPFFLLIYYAIIDKSLTTTQIYASIILIAGLVVLVLGNLKGRLSQKEIFLEISSALLFAISYIFLKNSFDASTFLTGLVYSKIILIPVVIAFLIIPTLKAELKSTGPGLNFWSKPGFIFLSGQAAGAISQFLLSLSISLANPALVNSLQGVEYGFLFILGLILSKKYPHIFQETHSRKSVIEKVVGIILIAAGLYYLLR